MARSGRRSGTTSARATTEETKARMVQAALESLHEEGVLGASARAIARRGGFNQALIFYHFGSVDQLLLAAIDELGACRTERYERRLAEVSSLRELVAVAGELHAQDLEDGHMTALSQMLAAAATNPELRQPMRDRFAPWITIIERTLERAVGGTPYAQLVPVHDLALAIAGEFLGLELLLNLEDDARPREHSVFRTFELLATLLEALVATAPAPGAGAQPSRP